MQSSSFFDEEIQTLIINPLSLVSKQHTVLDRLLKKHRVVVVFQANKNYPLDKTTRVRLTHTLVVKQLIDSLFLRSYFVLSEKAFAYGAYGSLFDLEGVIDYHLDQQTFLYHKLSEELGPWVLKEFGKRTPIRNYEHNGEICISISQIMKEHDVLRKCIHTKSSFFLGDRQRCYLLQKRLGTMELFDLLDSDLTDVPESLTLDLNHRLTLCVLLARQLQAQVHNSGIVHCDVRPENIMVNLTIKSKKLISIDELFIIDFGLSKAIGEKVVGHVAGHSSFLPPESRNHGVALQSSFDVYSLGRVCEMVFGYFYFLGKHNYIQMDGLSAEDNKRVRHTLQGMFMPQAEKRVLLADVDIFFTTLLGRYFPDSLLLSTAKRKRCLSPSIIEQGFFSEMHHASDKNVQTLLSSDNLFLCRDKFDELMAKSLNACQRARNASLPIEYASMLGCCSLYPR